MKKVLRHLAYWSVFVPLCFGTTISCWDHDSVFPARKLLRVDAGQLRRTAVTPHLRHPIRPGTNVLWCGTFQLAWNECRTLIGEPLRFAKTPGMADVLNERAFRKSHLEEASYVAVADFVRNGVFERIQRELREKFAGRARPRYLPDPSLTPRPQDIVAYAYLFKNLEFAAPFEDLKAPIRFGRAKESVRLRLKVACFGMAEYKDGQDHMRSQVDILEYKDPDDFIIELKSKSKSGRIILAKIAPAETLEKTIAAVQDRIRKAEKAREKRKARVQEALADLHKRLETTRTPRQRQEAWAAAGDVHRIDPSRMRPGDVLKVPKLNFDITRRYTELEGLGLRVDNPKVAKDLLILSALQNIRFQMDEKGVRLKSESHIAIGCGLPAPGPTHILIFDKPFGLMLQRRGAAIPYFALWIDNAELLVQRE